MISQIKPGIPWVNIMLFFILLAFSLSAAAEEVGKKELSKPIEVNGDLVEYSPDNKVVTAKGNVDVTYKGTKLSCEKLSVNTETKEALAEGKVLVEDEKGIIKGSKMSYNFNTKTGNITDAIFYSDPYFGKTKIMERVSEEELVGKEGY
ncbi:MAG: LPS export ABC transporter periplasmic protein LptC, partial [Candidatus Omnitrophota bacterium]